MSYNSFSAMFVLVTTPVVEIGDSCTSSEDCEQAVGSKCIGGACICDTGYYAHVSNYMCRKGMYFSMVFY